MKNHRKKALVGSRIIEGLREFAEALEKNEGVAEKFNYHTLLGSAMLPPFDDYGNLPQGIHHCTVAELVARFGSGSEERETETCELLDFIAAAKAAGVRRLMVNGSFVTGKLAPNDVDVVFLPGAEYPGKGPKLDNDELVWPFLQIILAADDADFERWATRHFATDRRKRGKGVVEVIL